MEPDWRGQVLLSSAGGWAILKDVLYFRGLQLEMANTISALKRVRMTKRKTTVNRLRKTRLRHQVRAMRRLIAHKDSSGAEKLLPNTFSLIDRSAKWGIIKPNTAARYKSRIVHRIKALASA